MSKLNDALKTSLKTRVAEIENQIQAIERQPTVADLKAELAEISALLDGTEWDKTEVLQPALDAAKAVIAAKPVEAVVELEAIKPGEK